MDAEPTFEQLLSWILDVDEEDEVTFAEWLEREKVRKEKDSSR